MNKKNSRCHVKISCKRQCHQALAPQPPSRRGSTETSAGSTRGSVEGLGALGFGGGGHNFAGRLRFLMLIAIQFVGHAIDSTLPILFPWQLVVVDSFFRLGDVACRRRRLGLLSRLSGALLHLWIAGRCFLVIGGRVRLSIVVSFGLVLAPGPVLALFVFLEAVRRCGSCSWRWSAFLLSLWRWADAF